MPCAGQVSGEDGPHRAGAEDREFNVTHALHYNGSPAQGGGRAQLRGSRMKHIRQADTPQQLRPHPVRHAVHDLRAILRRIDVHPERPLPERRIDDPHDGLGHACRVGIGRLQRSEPFQRDVGDIRRRAGGVLLRTRLIGRLARVREVIRALRERAGNDDRRLDAPARQLTGVGSRPAHPCRPSPRNTARDRAECHRECCSKTPTPATPGAACEWGLRVRCVWYVHVVSWRAVRRSLGPRHCGV